MPIGPHGGLLIDRTVSEEEQPEILKRTEGFPRVSLTMMERADLELISTGAYSPLSGFMGKADYESVVETGHLASGLPWTLPVVLGADAGTAAGVSEGDEVVLADEETGSRVGVMTVEERFSADLHKEAQEVFRTAGRRSSRRSDDPPQG